MIVFVIIQLNDVIVFVIIQLNDVIVFVIIQLNDVIVFVIIQLNDVIVFVIIQLNDVIVVVVVVDPTPLTCCQQSPAPESCGSQQFLPPGGKERLHFVGIRPEVHARKGGW